MTKPSKRLRAQSKPHVVAAEVPAAKRKKTTAKAASLSPLPMKASPVGRDGGRDRAPAARARADQVRKPRPADARAPEAAGISPADAVLAALSQWRDEMGRSVAQLTADPAEAATRQVATLLSGQRQVIEQVKVSLAALQSTIDACEAEVQPHGGAETSEPMPAPSQTLSHTPLPVPASAADSAPVAPATAIWSMQKAALSSVGVWAKVAQDCQGMWFGAVTSMMPAMRDGSGLANGAHQRETDRSQLPDRRDLD